MRLFFALAMILLHGVAVAQKRYSVSYEPSAQSQLRIQWLDWYGKPKLSPYLVVVITDTGSHKERVRQTFDSVTALTEHQFRLSPGYYEVNISLTPDGWSPSTRARITVRDSTCTRLLIRDTTGTLSFYYIGDPERPVTEFNFTARQRWTEDTVIISGSCGESFELIPANYHIRIGTLPVIEMSADVESYAVTAIGVPEPGFLVLAAAKSATDIELWHPLGTGFQQFHSFRAEMNREQRISLLPGVYELRYGPRAAQRKRFTIRSNTGTAVSFE